MSTIENTEAIKPVNKEVSLKGNNFEMSLAPYFFEVLRIKMR